MRAGGGVEGLAEAAARQQTASRDLTERRHEHIEIPRKSEVLKSVVQQVDRGAKRPFGEDTGEVAIRAHAHDGARHRPSQHQGFVAGAAKPGQDGAPVRDDHHTGHIVAAPIATAEDGGALALLHQPLGDGGHDRALARATHRQVADADDGTRQPSATVGVPLERAAPPPRDFAVEKVKQWV